jgi:hypothetical protein
MVIMGELYQRIAVCCCCQQLARDILTQMSERPEGTPPQEADGALYYRSAAYPSEHDSEQPYDTLKQTLHDEPCELSAFRLMLLPDRAYHVVALGVQPPPELQRRIEDILVDGTPSVLPTEVVAELVLRRLRQVPKGEWVEKSYRIRRGRRLE